MRVHLALPAHQVDLEKTVLLVVLVRAITARRQEHRPAIKQAHVMRCLSSQFLQTLVPSSPLFVSRTKSLPATNYCAKGYFH